MYRYVVVVVVVVDVAAAAVVVVVLTLTRTIKPVVTGQAPVTLEWRSAPGNNTNKSTSGTRIHHS